MPGKPRTRFPKQNSGAVHYCSVPRSFRDSALRLRSVQCLPVFSRHVLASATLLPVLFMAGCSSVHSIRSGSLAGVWHVHTYYLTIDQHGSGTFRWPTHVLCEHGVGFGPTACDTINPHGLISDGGHARLTLTRTRGLEGVGTVSSTSEESVVPDGKVQLRLGPNDVLKVRFEHPPSLRAYEYLCGPTTNTSTTNCGA